MNEQETCAECDGRLFHLDPDGRIICADDDCHAEFGTWLADGQAGLILQVPPLFGRRQPA